MIPYKRNRNRDQPPLNFYLSEESSVDRRWKFAFFLERLFDLLCVFSVEERSDDCHDHLGEPALDENSDQDVEETDLSHRLLQPRGQELQQSLLPDVGVDNEPEHQHGDVHHQDKE